MNTHIVRRLLPSEYHKYSVHLKSLNADSRYLRFGNGINDAGIDRVCADIEKNFTDHVLFCIEDAGLKILAVGHIATGKLMELAFSVLNEYQGQGMGNLLMHRCIQYCRAHDMLAGHMMCLSHNLAIRHMCSKHGITMKSEYGETLASIQLPRADFTTFVQESIADGFAVLDYINKRAHTCNILFANNCK
jgi:GNAT superfamily N-acetyltransferase